MAHTFPRRTHVPARRRCVVAAISVAVVASTAITAAYAGDPGSLKQQQKQTHHAVTSAKGDLDGSSHALLAAGAKLAAAKKQLAAAAATLHHTRVDLGKAAAADARQQQLLATARVKLAAAQAAEKAAVAAVAEQRRQIGVFAAHNYMYGDAQMLGLMAMFSGGSASDVSAQLSAVRSVTSKQDASLSTLDAAEATERKNRVAAVAAESQVAANEQAAAATLAAKKRLAAQALTEKNQVAGLVASRTHAQHVAANVRAHDARILRALQKKEARIKREIMQRSRHQRNQVVGDTGGLLQRPVSGYVTSPFGWRLHPIYHYWGLHNGDDFHAPCGTPEVAARGGTVISEYYSSVWGNRLYLDLGKINGHNFTVIYNHIERYRVHSGARVSRGEVLAYAGTTGWSTGCHLHFTVMRDGVAVNPLNYM